MNKIKIPQDLTPELAELCGIITGDGYIYKRLPPGKSDYRLEISLDKTEELEYSRHIRTLFLSVFGISLKKRNLIRNASLYYRSKQLVEYLDKLGLPSGAKARICKIPDVFLKNQILAHNFIKGLADTDFSIGFKRDHIGVHSQPRISGESASQTLMLQVARLLNEVGISYCYYKRLAKSQFGNFDHWRIDISGRKNLEKWMAHIGFSNPKHLSKLQLWQLRGYCRPYTTYVQRRKMIMEAESIKNSATNPPGRI